MNDIMRIAYRLSLVVIAIWVASKAFGLYQVHFPNRNHPMIPELQDMQTFCVGNYLIDLPRGSEPLRLETDLAGDRSSTFFAKSGVPRRDFEQLVSDRWEAVKNQKKNGLVVLDRPPQRFEVIADGIVITLNHRTTDLKNWPDGSTGPQAFYDTEGFLWRDETLYQFTSGSNKEGVINAMKSLQVRKDEEIPVGEGFCGGLSFFPGEPEANDYVWFAYRLPVEPHTEFRIKLPAIQPPRPDLALFESDQIKVRKLRDAKREIAGISGEEWIEYVWHNRFKGVYETAMEAFWFGAGPEEFGFPGIQLRLDASSNAENIPPPKIGEMIVVEGKRTMSPEDFTALWDGIAATLRPRLGALD